jgi:2-haloacid dehalogenase
MIRRYSAINEVFWQRLERNELTKPQVLVGRYVQFFTEIGIDAALAPAFNERYQTSLGDTIVFRDDSLNLIRSLQGRIRQYVVSNGTVVAQSKKLTRSGLGALMDGVFLSEELGVEKPNIGFFEKVFAAIPSARPGETLIVGDSLTSDIRGGMNAGIVTCWYNRKGTPVPEGYRIDHVIKNLWELLPLLGLSKEAL